MQIDVAPLKSGGRIRLLASGSDISEALVPAFQICFLWHYAVALCQTASPKAGITGPEAITQLQGGTGPASTGAVKLFSLTLLMVCQEKQGMGGERVLGAGNNSVPC